MTNAFFLGQWCTQSFPTCNTSVSARKTFIKVRLIHQLFATKMSDGASQCCSRLVSLSSLQIFCIFADSADWKSIVVVIEVTALSVVHPLPLSETRFLERVTGRNPKEFPPTDPFRHQDHVVTMVFKETLLSKVTYDRKFVEMRNRPRRANPVTSVDLKHVFSEKAVSVYASGGHHVRAWTDVSRIHVFVTDLGSNHRAQSSGREMHRILHS